MRDKIIKFTLLAVMVFIIVFFGFRGYQGRQKLEYSNSLNETVATVNGKDITFEDLAFYILYIENTVESQAKIYNAESTKDYWNLHINGKFIEQEAKDNVLDMAIHDRFFYELALENAMILDADEKALLKDRTADFWEDLFEEQLKRCPVDKSVIDSQLEIVALAEKYQNMLGETKGPSVAAYKYDGYYYQKMLEDADLKINKKLWSRFDIGEVTISHDKVNYVNGVNQIKEEQ